jgi:hypothetical protein
VSESAISSASPGGYTYRRSADSELRTISPDVAEDLLGDDE